MLEMPPPFLPQPAISCRSKERANIFFQRHIEFHDHRIGAGGETDADSKIIFDSVWQRALDDGKDVMLLFVAWLRVVYIADTAVKLNARRNGAHPAVVEAGGVAELETQMALRACYRFFENRIKQDGKRPDVLLHRDAHFELQCLIVELRIPEIFHFEIPPEIDRQDAFIEKSSAQTKF